MDYNGLPLNSPDNISFQNSEYVVQLLCRLEETPTEFADCILITKEGEFHPILSCLLPKLQSFIQIGHDLKCDLNSIYHFDEKLYISLPWVSTDHLLKILRLAHSGFCICHGEKDLYSFRDFLETIPLGFEIEHDHISTGQITVDISQEHSNLSVDHSFG